MHGHLKMTKGKHELTRRLLTMHLLNNHAHTWLIWHWQSTAASMGATPQLDHLISIAGAGKKHHGLFQFLGTWQVHVEGEQH